MISLPPTFRPGTRRHVYSSWPFLPGDRARVPGVRILTLLPEREPSLARSGHDYERAVRASPRFLRVAPSCEPGTARAPARMGAARLGGNINMRV
jgi:hypothetical protein